MSRTSLQIMAAGVTLAALASCGPTTGFDPDLRGWVTGNLNTSEAAAKAVPRPAADSRGIITFPNYQVVVARKGDTPATIAARLGLGASELAKYNALSPDTPLEAGATLVLPRTVAAGTAVSAGTTSTTGLVSDPFAGDPAKQTEAEKSVAPQSKPTTVQPKQHVVVAGETAWSISRKYGVSVQDLASWNGLPDSMDVRIGQRLMIPVAGQKPKDPTAITTAPGSGSPTPRPPSAAEPLPKEETAPAAAPGPKPPATDLGSTRTAASSDGRFKMPVSGSIIRVYEKGKNDGIDIAAAAGAPVKAAGSGTVAAITRDTAGVPIVVVRHDGGLMTVYTGLETLDVAKGESVSSGQDIGEAGKTGVVHFEVRRGFESVDPEDYLN
ncbi:LysM peptidoglycan-binding domain-containing protein [Paracoccus seriniphilus]|uniref:LysM peptidoglycan-binding domain-containing protein n=1 Tax=Paracoccus seriniphilus TaxID=184748 RepID=UPI003568F7FD